MTAFGLAGIVMMVMLGAFAPSDVEPLPAEQVLWGMPADCEVMGFVDLRNAGPNLRNVVSTIAGQSWVTSNPEISGAITEGLSALDQAQTQAVARYGFDPLTQLTAVSMCMRLEAVAGSEPRPQFLMVVQGSFPSSAVAPVAAEIDMNLTALPSGQSVYAHSEDGLNFGLFAPQDGVAIFGTDGYYTSFLGGMPTMAMPTPADSASLLSRMAIVAPGGVRSYFALRPSVATAFLIASEMPTSVAQLVQGLQSAVMATGTNATYFEATASNAATHGRFSMLFAGLGALSEASPLVVDGILNLVFGFLSPDDMELDSELRAMLAHRDEIMSTIESWGLNADVTVALSDDPAAMRSTMMLTSDAAMPGAAMIMLWSSMAVGMFGARMSSDAYDPYYMEAPVAPVHEGGLY